MSYVAKVYRVFIASPGDVPEERQMIREIILEWNSIHAATRRLILEPVGWETHSVPEVGDRPQAILNKQILKEADLLIAVFWTRLGTATGSHASGTVEEIEEHLAADKPVMIYFSDSRASLSHVDVQQYKALTDFRGQLQKRSLVEQYCDLRDFSQKFKRHLHTILNNSTLFAGAEVASLAPVQVVRAF
jgi:hypothetical protein